MKNAPETAGLSEEEARERLRRTGQTRPPPLAPQGPVAGAWRALLDPPALALLAAAGALGLAGRAGWAAAVGAAGAALLAAGLLRALLAERRMAGLARRLRRRATVIRDGRRRRIPAAALAPRDLVALAPGDRVPAPLRIVAEQSLRLDPAPKAEGPPRAAAGAMVLEGRGLGRVEDGGTLPRPAPARPRRDGGRSAPVMARVQRLALAMTAAGLALSAAAVLAMLVRGQATPGGAAVMLAALAAAALPHGLSGFAALALGTAARRLARDGVVVRDGRALERLGRVRFLCLDRTGLFGPEGQRPSRLVLGDGTAAPAPAGGETPDALPGAAPALAALLRAARQALAADPAADGGGAPAGGLSRAVVAEAEGLSLVLAGPPDDILPLCAEMATASGPVPLDPEALAPSAAVRPAGEEAGAAVLAVARGRGAEGEPPGDALLLLGLVVLEPGLHADTPGAVAALRRGRVHVALLTDRPAGEARAEGVRLGLATPWEHIVTGAALAEAAARGEPAIDNLVRPARVFAELAPGQKALIAGSFRRDGHLVGVSGRAAEDLAALAEADPALVPAPAACDAALEAGCVILREDRLAPLAAAVDGARAGIERLVRLALATGGTAFGIGLFVLLSVLLFGTAPLHAQALLALGAAVGLLGGVGPALGPTEPKPSGEPRRRLPARLMPRALALHMAAGAMAVALAGLAVRGLAEAGGHAPDAVRGSALVALALAAGVRALALRRARRWALAPDFRASPWAWGVAAALPALAVAATLVEPAARALAVAPVPGALWPAVLGAGAAVLAVEDWLRRLRLAEPDPVTRRGRG